MSPIIEVPIPVWPCVGCPVCHAIAVNLDGELMCCSDAECVAGRAFRSMVEAQQTEATRRLRLLGKHVEDCAYCQRANDRRGLCVTGQDLWGRWFAWLVPAGVPTSARPPASTSVRNLTDEERAELQPLLRELHAHVEGCAPCQTSGNVETAADLGASGLCEEGQRLYRRWLEWLAQS